MTGRRSFVAHTQCIRQLVNECTDGSVVPVRLSIVDDGYPTDESVGYFRSSLRD